MNPILKWAGGKTKLLDEIKSRMPRKYCRYFEPFLGGGALFFDLEPSHAVINDANAALIGTYKAIRDRCEEVSRVIELLRPLTDEDNYYRARQRFNARMRTVEMSPTDAATFIWLNRMGFNGLYRVNRDGNLNVPWGKLKKPPAHPGVATLARASSLFARNYLRCGDYAEAVEDADPGDLVYFDPPYDPLNETSAFTAYTGDGFGTGDQRKLAELIRTLVDRGVYVIASNSDTAFTRDLYAGLELHRVARPGNINSEGTKRGPVSELLVVARPKREILHELFDTSEVTV